MPHFFTLNQLITGCDLTYSTHQPIAWCDHIYIDNLLLYTFPSCIDFSVTYLATISKFRNNEYRFFFTKLISTKNYKK